MKTIQANRERLNGYRLFRQALWPRCTDAAEAIEAVGFLPPREAAYLCMAARVVDFRPEDLTRAVFTDHRLVELASLTDQSRLVPREVVAAAIRFPATRRKEEAERVLEDVGVSVSRRLALKSAVTDALSDGALTQREIRERLEVDYGEAGDFVGREGVLASILALLQTDGTVLRTNLSGDLVGGPSVLELADRILPGGEVAALAPQDALKQMCAYYFRVHGPATLADFCWFTGAVRADAERAVADLGPGLFRVVVADLPYDFILSEPEGEELLGWEPTERRPVALVPWRDPWLTSHEGRLGRFVRKKDLPRILPGPALPAILVSGAVAGRWSLAPARGEIELTWFTTPTPSVKDRAAELAHEIGGFASRHLAGVRPLTIPCEEGDVAVYS